MVKSKNQKKTVTNEAAANSTSIPVNSPQLNVPNTSTASKSNTGAANNRNHSKRDREKSTSVGSQNNSNYRDRKINEKHDSNTLTKEKEKKDKDRSNNSLNGNSLTNRKDKTRENSSQSRHGSGSSNSTKANNTPPTVIMPTTSSETKKEDATNGPQLSPINEKNQAMFEKEGADSKKRVSLMKRHGNRRLSDTLLAFLEHTEWDKVDLMCEILCMLNAIDLRLVGNCVEGLARNHTHQMKPVEKCANSDNPMSVFPSTMNFYVPASSNNEEVPTSSASSSSNQKSAETSSTSCSSPDNLPNGILENQEKESPDNAFQRISSILNALYAIVAVLSSSNRKSASQIATYLDGILSNGRPNYFRIIHDPVQKMVILQMIGKIVSACVHHPAFSSTDRIRYAKVRDELRCELEIMHKKVEEERRKDAEIQREKFDKELNDDSENEEDDDYEDDNGMSRWSQWCAYSGSQGSLKYAYNIRNSSGRFIYVNRFLATHIPAANEVNESFQISIQWSDNEETYVNRTRDELWTLHHKLLDKFGNLRNEKAPGNCEASSEEGTSKVSSSTNTIDGSQPKCGTRILPMLKKDAQPADVVYYINSLSDLPAKIILSDIIAEEFGPTRRTTSDDDESADGIILPRCGVRIPRVNNSENQESGDAAASISPSMSNYPVPIVPLIYGNIPHGHVQIYEKTCSNCGGNHLFQYCDKPNIIERKNEYKLDYDDPSNLMGANQMIQSNGGPGHLAPPPGLHIPPMTNNHFTYHQHQHHQHQQFFNTNAQQQQPYRLIQHGQSPFDYSQGPFVFTAAGPQQQQQQQQNGNF